MRATRSPVTLLIAMTFLSLMTFATSSSAKQPSQEQCTCQPDADPNNNIEFLTGVSNGALCVLTEGPGRPVCYIQVYCLSDGTGSGCDAYEEGLSAAQAAATSGELDLKPFVEALYESISAGAEAADIEVTFDLELTIQSILESEESLVQCFAALGNRAAEPVALSGEAVSCNYSPYFGTLTIDHGSATAAASIPAIQLVGRR